MGPLSTIFYDGLRKRRTAADLEPLLADVVARGRAAWPHLPVAPESLIRQLAAHLPDRPPEKILPAIHAADLHLACACAAQLPSAIEALELHFMARVPRFVRHLDRSLSFAAEVQQTLRVMLLVALPGPRPRIGEFAGTRSLASWLRLLAVRAAIDLMGRLPEEPGAARDLADRPLVDELDLEGDLVRERHRQAFQGALDEALATLSGRERELLREHFVEDRSIEALAAAHHVHRATCARWLATAREKLIEDTRRRVIARLRLSPSEVESLAGLIEGGLDVTLAPRRTTTAS
jgi:RNA polymerase sigma-70 factor (ECF subfamily)